MPMGIVSNKEFEHALEDATASPKPTSVQIVDMEKGRGKGNVEVPDGLRKIIGEESAINGRASALEIANQFGVSPSSVSAYAHGANSTSSYDQQPGLEKLNEARLRVAKKARNRLITALNSLTKEKIESAKAKEIAGVAKDMSVVIKNMEPDGPKAPTNSGPTFVFYSPTFKREEHFDVVRVTE
jgi:predicted transcriptional regulator